MLRKTLITSVIALSLLAPTLASADVVTDTTGVEVAKNTSVKLAYDLIVGDLTSADYTVSVVKSDNDDLDKSKLNETTDIGGGGEITGATALPYIITVTLTDSGKAKVKAETGVTDPDSIAIVAAIPGDNNSITYGSVAGVSKDNTPTIATPVVLARQSSDSGKISTTSELKNKIVDAKSKQDKAQAKIKVSKAAQDLLDKSGMAAEAGAELSEMKVNQTTVHRSITPNKKQFDAAERAKTWQQIGAVAWRVAGILILMAAGAGTAYGVWRWQKKHKEN